MVPVGVSFSLPMSYNGAHVAQMVKNLLAMQETEVWNLPGKCFSPFWRMEHYPLQFSCLENAMANYSSWGRKESDTTEQLT